MSMKLLRGHMCLQIIPCDWHTHRGMQYKSGFFRICVLRYLYFWWVGFKTPHLRYKMPWTGLHLQGSHFSGITKFQIFSMTFYKRPGFRFQCGLDIPHLLSHCTAGGRFEICRTLVKLLKEKSSQNITMWHKCSFSRFFSFCLILLLQIVEFRDISTTEKGCCHFPRVSRCCGNAASFL